MKQGLVESFFALKLLKDHEMKLGGNITFESIVGEEAGEAGTLECCRRGYTFNFAIVCDTSNNQTHHDGVRG